MSRTVNVMGLSTQAYKWLEENAYKTPEFICTECSQTILSHFHTTNVPKGIIEGFGGEELYTLQQYELFNGKFVEEYVQAEIWNSGPNIYLALRYLDGAIVKESLWDKEVIEN